MDNAAFGTQLAQAIRSGEPNAMVEDTVSSSEGQ